MHCIKTINIEHEYGITRLYLLTTFTFILVFSLSYVSVNFFYAGSHNDSYFDLFVWLFVMVYPLHKWLHFITLFQYRKAISFRMKIKFIFIPVLHMRFKEMLPKRRYLLSLIAPFLCLNSLFLSGAIFFPMFNHYFCLLLGFHCSICILDFLSIKTIWHAPAQAYIEETPRGYEILVQE